MKDVLLDACCLINLLSSGCTQEILLACGHVFYVCEAVAQESLFVDVRNEGGARQRIAVDLAPLFESGAIRAAKPEATTELAALIHYASTLDDGEAMCVALAKCRSWTLATDDRKVRRLASAEGLGLLSTIELLKEWSEQTNAVEPEVKSVVDLVATLGRYRPSQDAPIATWWREKGGPLANLS